MDMPQGETETKGFQHLQLTDDRLLKVYLAGALATLNLDLDMEASDLAAAILAAISGMPVEINSTGAAGTATVPTPFIKTVSDAGTPEALAADGTFFRTATIIGNKAARTVNVGTVYLGIGVTNDTQFIPITAGGIYVIRAPMGQKYDLNDFSCDVINAGDGVAGWYS